MNATQALSRLRKLWGKTAALRDTKKQSSPEIREQARAIKMRARSSKEAAESALTTRRDEILKADTEYQRLKAEYQAQRTAFDRLSYGNRFRYQAGIASPLFFTVRAEGDNLDELMDKCGAGQ